MLLGTLGSSLIGNLLTGKRLFRAGSGNNEVTVEKECRELVKIKEKRYLEQDKELKKVINTITSFNKH